MKVLDIAGQAQPSDMKSDLSDIAIIDISAGKNIRGGAAALNTAGLQCVGVLNVPQNQMVAMNPVPNSQIVTLDDTKSVLIVSHGHAQNNYFLISQVNEGVQTGNVLYQGVQTGNISNPGIVILGCQEAMVGDVTKTVPSHEGTHAFSVTNPDVINTDSKQRQEYGRTNAESVYTLKAVVESETDKDKQNDKVTDAIPKTEASGSEEECHSAEDVLTVGQAMIGDCSRESKTDSELERFGVFKYKIGSAADLEEQSKKNVENKEKKESDESIESKERKQGDKSKTGNESQKEGVVKVKEQSDEFETCDESPKVVEEESKAKEIEQSEKNESQKEGVVEDSKKKEEGTKNSEYSETDDSVECKKTKGGEKSDKSEGTEVSIKKPSEKNVEKSKHKGADGDGHLTCF